jgi:Kef-type K+ transport system membrane component KefB
MPAEIPLPTMISVTSTQTICASMLIEKHVIYNQTRMHSKKVWTSFYDETYYSSHIIGSFINLTVYATCRCHFQTGNFLVFIFAAYLLGIISNMIGMSPQFGYLIAGAALGPSGADIIPFPAVMGWVGELSAIGLALDAGLDTELDEVEEDSEGVVANFLSGTLLSILAGIGIGHFGLGLNAQNVIALIACLYPTGKEVAIPMLERGGVGNTPAGSYIRIACALDDYIPLILVVILQAMSSSNGTSFKDFLPLIYTVGLFIVVGVPTIMFIPKVIDTRILNQVRKGMRLLLTVSLMIILMTGLVILFVQVNASHLVATFITGLTFSQITTGRDEFQAVRRNFFTWIRNIFFATSVGFQVSNNIFKIGAEYLY